MKKPLVIIIAIFFVVGAGALVVPLALTFAASGDKAVAKMTAEEKPYLEKVALLRRGMSATEVEKILGPADREGAGLRPTWRVNGSEANQIAVYFGSSGLRKVRWMSLGKFFYEPEIP